MTLNVAVGIVVAVCVLCLLTSIAVLLKAQEIHSQCVDILHFTYDWLEEIHHEPEVKAHEGTEQVEKLLEGARPLIYDPEHYPEDREHD